MKKLKRSEKEIKKVKRGKKREKEGNILKKE